MRAENGELRGRVLEVLGGVYRVRPDVGGVDVDASIRGRLKMQVRTGDRVVPGDRVIIQDRKEDDGFTVEEVLPRDNELVRAGPGGRKPKIVAANLDRCVVVLSVLEPPFQEETADRFLALAEGCGIPPVLVLNKVDLEGGTTAVHEAVSAYRRIGYPVVTTSSLDGEGLAELEGILSTGVSALVGPSGVGKSSLVNALDPTIELRTAPVSRRGGRGRHTTVSARLLPLSAGGWVVDTPGFSEVNLWGVDPQALLQAFPEFREPAASCRFRGCSHTHEPECGVKDALEEGRVFETRYRSYRSLLAEGADRPAF